MDRGNLAELTAFVAVADRLSFRAAASQLGITPSALSHSMRQLEERLGMRLLHRTTRSVSLTDAGRRLLDRLRPAIDQIAGALEDLNQERQRPMGRLRIYMVHIAGAAVVAPIWRRFLCTYPEVHLELAVGEAPIDIVANGFDAGIGPRDRAPADMIAVRVMGPMVRRLILRTGGRRGRPMISPVTAALNIGWRLTALHLRGRSSEIAKRSGFRSTGE
jgi:DNA-binding transcriptional LysR family regulator